DDGMAELAAVLPAVLAYAIRDRLTEYARELTTARRKAAAEASAAGHRGTGAGAGAGGDDGASVDGAEATPPDPAEVVVTDTRTTDQVRADVLTDLLLTGGATAPATTGAVADGGAITAQVQVIIPLDTLTGTGTSPAELVGYGPIDPETARRLAATAELWERIFVSP
ncbi:DUF222 domain-containing protein, partial [Microbacterium sp. Sa4CUA7]